MAGDLNQIYQEALKRAAQLTPDSYEEYYLGHQEKGLDWNDDLVVEEELGQEK